MRPLIPMLLMSTNLYALAPPPINFTREEVKVEGKTFIVTFDGRNLDMREKRRFEVGSNLVGLLLILGILFWGSLIFFVIWKTGYIVEFLIFILSSVLILDVVRYLRKWR